MTFNIRYDNPDDGIHAWSNRKDDVVRLIQAYQPAIFGIQEGLHHQVIFLDSMLGEYTFVGVGRDDGIAKGEYSAVFYKSEIFELLNQGTFWLSELPDIPGSMGWDAACTRIVTWAELHETLSGKRCFIFNTHFDHLGTEARVYSALLLRRKVSEISGSESAVITGDFNFPDTSFAYKVLTKKMTEQTPPFTDTRKVSIESPAGPEWTFQGFDSLTQKTKLDYIFYTGNARILSHTTIRDPRFGEYPSDHLPVMVKLIWE